MLFPHLLQVPHWQVSSSFPCVDQTSQIHDVHIVKTEQLHVCQVCGHACVRIYTGAIVKHLEFPEPRQGDCPATATSRLYPLIHSTQT